MRHLRIVVSQALCMLSLIALSRRNTTKHLPDDETHIAEVPVPKVIFKLYGWELGLAVSFT